MELLNMNRIIVLIVISISSLMLNLYGAAAHPQPTTQIHPAIKKICDSTENPAVCASSVVPYLNGQTDPASVLSMQVNAGIHATERAIEQARQAMNLPSTTPYVAESIKSCLDCYNSAMDSWKNALGSLKARSSFDVANHLSSVSSMITSCEDAFTNDDPTAPSNSPLAKIDSLIMKMNSNGLGIRLMAFPEH